MKPSRSATARLAQIVGGAQNFDAVELLLLEQHRDHRPAGARHQPAPGEFRAQPVTDLGIAAVAVDGVTGDAARQRLAFP